MKQQQVSSLHFTNKLFLGEQGPKGDQGENGQDGDNGPDGIPAVATACYGEPVSSSNSLNVECGFTNIIRKPYHYYTYTHI